MGILNEVVVLLLLLLLFPFLHLLGPERSVIRLNLLFQPIVSLTVLVVVPDLLIELFSLACKHVASGCQTLGRLLLLAILHADQLRVTIVFQQAERVPREVWHARPEIGRLRMRALDLLDLRVSGAPEGVCDAGRVEELVEGAVLRRFLLLALRVGQRGRDDTLVFLAVEVVLVQALLFLLDKSFLQRQLLLLV